VKQKKPNETKNNTPGTNANAVPVGSSNAINANKRRKLNIAGETAATPPAQLIGPMFAALSIQTNLSDHQRAGTLQSIQCRHPQASQ